MFFVEFPLVCVGRFRAIDPTDCFLLGPEI